MILHGSIWVESAYGLSGLRIEVRGMGWNIVHQQESARRHFEQCVRKVVSEVDYKRYLPMMPWNPAPRLVGESNQG